MVGLLISQAQSYAITMVGKSITLNGLDYKLSAHNVLKKLE